MNKLNINGKEIDLSLVRALKMRDWAALDSMGIREVSNANVTQLMQFLHYVLRRSRPDIEMADIEELSATEFAAALKATREAMDNSEASVDVPFSVPHTS